MEGRRPWLVTVVVLVLASALITNPQVMSQAPREHPMMSGVPLVYVGYLAVVLDDSSINVSRVEEMVAEVSSDPDLAGLDLVVSKDGRNYVVFMTSYSPHYLVVAYNNGSKVVVSIHYAPTPEAVMWWGWLDADIYVNTSSVAEKASEKGWDVIYNSSRTYMRCTTATVTCTSVGNYTCSPATIPPTCFNITQAHIVLWRRAPRAYIVVDESAQLENGSITGIPRLSLVAYVESTDSDTLAVVKEMLRSIAGSMADYIKWKPPVKEGYIDDMKDLLRKYLIYFAHKGILLTSNQTLQAAMNAVSELTTINSSIEVSGSSVSATEIVPPNPYSLTNQPDMIPCNEVFNPPGCTIVTTTITITAPSYTPPHTQQTTTTSIPQPNTGTTGTGTTTGTVTGNVLVGEEVRNAGIALAVALASAGLVWALLRRG